MIGSRPGCLVAVLMLLAGPWVDRAAARVPDGTYSLADVASAPRFEDYPAGPGRRTPRAPPLLRSRDARMFRTVLRNAAAEGPNFAGHYAVAGWGCGMSCISAAIVDTESGRVLFDDGLSDISTDHVGEPDAGNSGPFNLVFRMGAAFSSCPARRARTRPGMGSPSTSGPGVVSSRSASCPTRCGADPADPAHGRSAMMSTVAART